MKVIRLEVGYLETNCYVLFDETTRIAAVIDPGGSEKNIVEVIEQEKLAVEFIINTHGHVDHISANAKIKKYTGAPILIHIDDAQMLTNPQSNLSAFVGSSLQGEPADRLLEDGEEIKVGTIILKVIHTPGHTPGGICLQSGATVFCGDTIFRESIGRTDFVGGSFTQIIASIKNKLMILADDTTLLPGHGPETTVGWERRRNPFIQ